MSDRFLPLDLPKFEHKDKVLSAFTENVIFGYWHEEELTERNKKEPFEKEMPFTENAVQKYPELLKYIKTNWPFEYFVYVKLIRANRTVQPHVDGNFVNYKGPAGNYNTITEDYLNHQLKTEPCGYRMIINGNRNSLYLCNEYDSTYKTQSWPTLEKQYCNVPEDTDCFVLRTNNNPHGVDYIENDNNRLLLFAIGKLNITEHNKLLYKSRKKYVRHQR
jgi:hypothetical protein